MHMYSITARSPGGLDALAYQNKSLADVVSQLNVWLRIYPNYEYVIWGNQKDPQKPSGPITYTVSGPNWSGT